ncbi:MAG: M48 family metallopeptidase [Candidatus Omnitrophica bacterium]|nr:M48 family metallopeptidase [Candidatus Omnitrophota bacterium]MDD5546156.1 M48 family metallopeptidase [Candidatus Omnitrophota bacterium]
MIERFFEGGSGEGKRYSRIKNVLFGVELVLTVLFLYIMATQGPSVWIRNFAEGASRNPWIQTAAYFLVFGAIYAAVTFTLDMYQGFSLERKFSLSTQTFGGWVLDYLKKLLVGGTIFFILIEALYLFLRNFTATWWIWTAVFWIIFTIVLSRLAPVVILPLFFKVKPLADEDLRVRLLNLAEKCGSKVNGIFEIDLSKKTVKANAALAGLGKTRRVLLGDTMLKEYTHDEIEAVLAHELGHHKKGHIMKLLVFGAAVTFVSFYIANLVFKGFSGMLDYRGIADLAGFPLLALIFFFFAVVMMPFQNGLSRVFEREADRFALEITQNPGAFISMMGKLGDQNLADREPNRLIEIFLYDHPSIGKRLKIAEEYKNKP